MDLGFLVHTWCTITENSIFFFLFEFFNSCIYYFPLIITLVYVDTDYFFFLLSELHFQLSISLIFSLLKDSTSSISNTSKVRSSYFFVVIKCNFSLAQKSTKKFTIPQLSTMICFAQKEKVLYERERLWWEEPIHFFELSYLLFRSEWMNLLYSDYVQK